MSDMVSTKNEPSALRSVKTQNMSNMVSRTSEVRVFGTTIPNRKGKKVKEGDGRASDEVFLSLSFE